MKQIFFPIRIVTYNICLIYPGEVFMAYACLAGAEVET